jgi:hypothetical protein
MADAVSCWAHGSDCDVSTGRRILWETPVPKQCLGGFIDVEVSMLDGRMPSYGPVSS